MSDSDEEQVQSESSHEVEKNVSDLESAMQNLLKYFVKHKLSFSCLEDTAKLMNSMPGARVQLPVTKYVLLREFMWSFDLQYNIYCERCNVYTTCIDRKSQWICVNCSNPLKIRETNHFVYIPVLNQIKQMLHRHWREVRDFKSVIGCGGNQQNMHDVYSGELLRKIMSLNNNVLSLTISTDGVSLRKSNTASFWPLQIVCNFLPPNLRYRKENIIVAAFFYGSKPDMCNLFEPFVKEMAKLETEGFLMNDEFFQPIVTHATFDLPAKAAFQKIRQYNGYYACGYCLHPGEATSDGIRYTYMTEESELRTHTNMLSTLNNVNRHRNDKDYVENGVYGISPAIGFEHFDLINSFGVDYMHCVTIGVVKKMLDSCLGITSHSSYLSKKKRIQLDRRICAIRPCRFVSRLPRSLEQRKLFKASEYRSLLLYYLPVCLRGIVDKKFLDHFNLLSSSVYTLLKTNISIQDFNDAEQKLKLYEIFHGKNSMTMNVHLLLHITTSVKYLGPLWSTSMFSFESNNATFGQCVKGNTDIISQIATKYAISRSALRNQLGGISGNCESVEVMKLLRLGKNDEQNLRAHNIYIERKDNNVEIYCIFKKNGEMYTSISYNRSIKTIDYFVELQNKLIGKIKFYVRQAENIYFILEEFELVGNTNHISEIIPKQTDSVHTVSEIEKKMIYINFNALHFITDRPNSFESD